MIGQFGQLWKMFIRPTRQEYTIQDLGFEIQVFKKYKAKRIDLVIPNKKGLKLQCSLFEPSSLNTDHNKQTNDKYPCVVYCHCNSGSRMEALRLIPDMIDRGIALFCFDFSGSGLSEGEYVTLGVNESQDLECVIEYLHSTGKISNIALWGRSMGAVTTFLYTSKNSQKKPLKGIVFDSGFSNLNFLAMDLAKQKTGMPNLIIEPALSLINDQVKERVELNIQGIDLAKILHNMYTPVYFVCSKEDTFVRCEHSEQLFHRYNGQKWLSYVTGDHNAPRSSETIAMLADWISNQLFERNQDHHLDNTKGSSGFPRKNTLTNVAKIDLGQLESPQQSLQQLQQRKGSYQISPGLPIDQRRSPRAQAHNSSQTSPSARLDTRSVSPILQNPLRQQQFGTTTSQGVQQQQQQQQQNQSLQQLAVHGIPTEKYSSYLGTQEKPSEYFHSKNNQFPPTLNAYSHVSDRTKSPGFSQHSPIIRGYSSIGSSQQPFKINLQAAPSSPQAGKHPQFQYSSNLSYQSPNLHAEDAKINQTTISPSVPQKEQDSPRKYLSNQHPQQYPSVYSEPQKQLDDDQQRLSLKQQQINDQGVQEKTSQSQQESLSSQSRIPTEENSSISGNAGNCGIRGNSAQHGFSFLSNPNEELISNDRNSTPSRKPPRGPTGTQGSSSNNNLQNKQEESSQDSSNSSKPPKKIQDSQQAYEPTDERSSKESNPSSQAPQTVENIPLQVAEELLQIPKQHNKIQVAPIILTKTTIHGSEEGLETPQFLPEKRQNILLQTDDSPFSSPGLIAQEQPLESIPQPLPYTNTRNLSHFYQVKQASPRNSENNQEKSLNNPQNYSYSPSKQQQPQAQQLESKPQQPSPQQQQQQQQQAQLQQPQTNQHRSVRSSTYSSSATPTNSSTQIPSNSNIDTNNLGSIGPAFPKRQRNIESSKSEIPQNLGDLNSPKLAYQTSTPRNKEQQPSSSSTSTFSQASQQQDFLSIKSNFLSSYSHSIPTDPLAKSSSNNVPLGGGNIRIRPQNNSLDMTNSLGFLQDLSKKNTIPVQMAYLGGSNYQSQKANKLNTFSTNKSQETSAALASIPLISQDHQKPPIFEHHMKAASINTMPVAKTFGFAPNLSNASNTQVFLPQYASSSGQQQQQQQQQDKKNQVKVVGISIVSPRLSQQKQHNPQEYEHHKTLSQQSSNYQQYYPKDSANRVQTETASYSSVANAAASDQGFKAQQNQGKEVQSIKFTKETTNFKEVAPHNSLCNTPAGDNHNGVSSNPSQAKNNLESTLNINNYNTNPGSSANSNNMPKNAGTGFSLGPSKYFTTYDAQSYPQEVLQKPAQPQQQPQQTFSEVSQKFAFATQVSPATVKQTYSLANTPKLSQQQQQSKQSLPPQGTPQPSRSYFETHLASMSNNQTNQYNSSNPYNAFSNNNMNSYKVNQPSPILPTSSNHTSHTSSTNSSLLYNNNNNPQLGIPMTSSKGIATPNSDLLKQYQSQQSQQKYSLPPAQAQSGSSSSSTNTSNVQSNK